MLGEVFSDLQQPTLMSRILDNGLGKGDMHYVLRTAALMAFFAVVGLVAGVSCNALGSYASLQMGAALRQHMLQVALTSRNPRGLQPATIITRITNDVIQMQNLVLIMVRGMVRAPLLMMGGAVMSVIVCPQLAWLLLIVMPLLLIFMVLVVRRSVPLFTRVQQSIDHVNQIMRENLNGMKTIKSYALEDSQYHRFNGANEQLQSDSEVAQHSTIILSPVILLVLNLAVVIALAYGGRLDMQHVILDGQIIAFVNYMIQITNAMIGTVNIITAFSRASTSAIRVRTALDEENQADALDQQPGHAQLPAGSGFDFDHVSFGYGKRPILADIDFHVADGTWLGVIGTTGSGKTTLVNLLTRAFDDYQGHIMVGGTDVQALTLTELHHKVAVALQDSVLFSGSVRDDLRYGQPDGTDSNLARAIHDAAADDFIDAAGGGLDLPVEQHGKNFSGGQRQRLNLSRALAADSDILVLDDITSAVDQETNARIQQRLRTSRRGRTTMIISQRISNLVDCDQIIVLEGGRITGRGTHAELIRTSSFYRRLVAAQFGEETVANANA
ncbi:abc-type multidrug transport system, atpase and permease component [Lacticaseibacillus thailandensis DSM 22698 = JCM 13996]|uniref:Abc-type multidrug transport system, atpase and permease component n=2 Tax=Lacticaseibacillus thailandensis TaxID=381741 RepID=A0A0R2C842_9LACO|nr:abc-type multidrug transport system, atpase and permease component [Lacticaseibacillus thailandensis DSM 22698 = JCM 13996]